MAPSKRSSPPTSGLNSTTRQVREAEASRCSGVLMTHASLAQCESSSKSTSEAIKAPLRFLRRPRDQLSVRPGWSDLSSRHEALPETKQASVKTEQVQ
eukprot:scaffold731_cov261-Pinguiococcus_pyrenoidosus.AAC.89